MTFKEKLKQEHPEKVKHYFGCPRDYKYEIRNKECSYMSCFDCWNREIPEKEDETTNLSDTTEMFICKKCKIVIEGFIKITVEVDGLGYEENGCTQYDFKYCPECGRKVVSK